MPAYPDKRSQLIRAFCRVPAASPLFHGKGLIHGGRFTDKYYTLYLNYQKLLEAYLLLRLPLKRYDDKIKNAGLYFAPVVQDKQDFFQQFSFPELDYLYLRNPLYVEKLSPADIDLVLRQSEQALKKPGNELLRLVSRTYKSVINASPDNGMDGISHMVCYGPDLDEYWHDSRKMIFGIRYGEFADSPLGEDTEWLNNYNRQLSFLGELIRDLEEGCSAILAHPVAFLYYDDASVSRSMLPSPKPQPKPEFKPKNKDEQLAEEISKEAAAAMEIASKIESGKPARGQLPELVRSIMSSMTEVKEKSRLLSAHSDGTKVIQQLVSLGGTKTLDSIVRHYGDRMTPLAYELLEFLVKEFGDLPEVGPLLHKEKKAFEASLVTLWEVVHQGVKSDVPMDWLKAVVEKISPKHRGRRGSSLGSGMKIAIGALVLAAVIVVALLLNGHTGAAALERGDYKAAVSSLRLAPFHQELYQEALEKWENQIWEEAADMIAAGSCGEALNHCKQNGFPALYTRACVSSGEVFLQVGRQSLKNSDLPQAAIDFSRALSYYKKAEDDALYQEGSTQVGMAYLDFQYHDEALPYFEVGSAPYHYCKGIASLPTLMQSPQNSWEENPAWKNLDTSLSHFRNAEGLGSSADYIAVLNAMSGWDFIDAITRIQEMPSLQEELSLKDWLTVLHRLETDTTPPSVPDGLNLQRAIAAIDPKERELIESELAAITDTDTTAILTVADKATDAKCAPKEELLASNRDTADKKVLIIKGLRGYNASKYNWYVDFELMSQLPAHWIPEDLSQVEYLVTITYDYEDSGDTYTSRSGGTVVTRGMREKALVHLYTLKTGAALYTSKTIKGASPPFIYTYFDSPPMWISGDRPAVSGELIKVLKKIDSLIK